MKEVRFWIPENLDIDAVIEENRKVFEENGLKKPQLLYICSAITNSRARNRRKMDEDGTPFAPLWAKKLKEIVYDYSLYIDFLLSSAVWLTDDLFIVGEKCRGYRFNFPYDGQPLVEVVMEDYRLGKAITNAAKKYKEEMKAATWGYGYLTKWWDDKIDIDTVQAHKWIKAYTKSKIESIKADKNTVNRLDLIDNAKNTAEDFKYLVRCIKKHDYYFRFSGVGHRFYNNFGNLKKELRPFLSYNGQGLVDVDIKNSQPFLSLAIFDPKFWIPTPGFEKKSLKWLCKDIYEDIRSSKYYNDIITLVETSESQYSIESNMKKYTDLVLEGQFYEFIQDNFQPLYPERFSERSKVKIEVLRILYSDPILENIAFYKPCQTFRKCFPEVYKLFKLIKKVQQNYLPLILQRIESHLVIDVVCKSIGRLHPEIPLFTIHDNIITTKGNEFIVQQTMVEEILNWIGYKPNVDITELKAA